ncbi:MULTISPECIES: hypothetical protein [unclassified Streptomyces]|uniref:hypothetical protein n=1 Tax=unclassified Streptomyces TaxID=2593676 RepID=UPI004041EBDB
MAARAACRIRPGGTGWPDDEIQHARVVAAEVVHHGVLHTPAPALFARLRHRSVLAGGEATCTEAHKLHS